MRFQKAIAFCLLSMLFILLSRCNQTDRVSYVIGQSTNKLLSDYNFFKGTLSDLNPVENVIPYDLNAALFSDYAYKARFVWLPEHTHATVDDPDEVIMFPVGSILIKNFYYPDDFRNEEGGRRIMETRLLIHEEEGWIALPYIWNDEQTDATLALAGGNRKISWIHHDGSVRELNYSVPDKNQCKNCHQNKEKIIPIGPKIANLNKDIRYSDGLANQLEKWKSINLLQYDNPTSVYGRFANYDDKQASVEERARSYLDINCGHCHNPDGSGHTSGLNLSVLEKEGASLGICKSPISAGKGTGGLDFDIAPGKADSSILLYRMISNDPSIMMPEIGRKIEHEEGIALIREWINELEGSCY
ncbi:MAG: hypothetical protein HKN92_11240 [Chitinophagales bacterium]|nr:hypothetical protein [Chitinophagales bacterium]